MKTEYTILELLLILKKRIWLIVICAVISTAGIFSLSEFVIDEKYAADLSLYVEPNSSSSDTIASLNELNYAKAVVNTYIEILKTNAFMESVSIASGLEYSKEALKEMVAINAVNDTEIFRVVVTTKNPRDSYILAVTIGRLAPEKIIEIKDADAVKLVDPATLPKAPSEPNIMLNTVIGFCFGLLGGGVIALLLEILDKRVKDEDDLIKNYSVPILGLVPKIEN